MQAYSMDLRERALLDSDAGMRRGRCGEVPRERVVGAAVEAASAGDGRSRAARPAARATPDVGAAPAHLGRLIAEQPDRTLAELKDALGTPASLATIWRAVAALDVTVKKNGPALRTRST